MSRAAEPAAIRRLGPGDAADAARLNAVFAAAFEDHPTYLGAPPGDDWIARWLARPDLFALVAEVDGTIVGGLIAYELDKFEQARCELYTYDLAVLETHRRRGIARALIGWLQHVASERGEWTLYVQADPEDGPAVALYTSLGRREDVLHFDIAPAGKG